LLVQHINESTGKVYIEDYNQLASDTVWVVKNSPFIDRITNLTEELGCDTIYVMESEEYSSEQLVILTALGEIKRAVVNANVAKKMAKDYPQLDINTKISFNQFQVWVLKQDNQSLCNRINEWITEIKSSKEYELILQKYIQK
jgi:membrane-bound lytic murein transglycosylase MltF